MKRRDPSQHRRCLLIDPGVEVGARWSTGDFVESTISSSSAAQTSTIDGHPFFADNHHHHRHLGATNSSRDLLSEFGAFSSMAPPTSPVFGYSQKNFHISDGNLYSVLSPFQARRSSARPSFLRGQSCVTSVDDSNHQHHYEHQQSESTSSFTSTNADAPSTSSTTLGRRSKLKFHHQDTPLPYAEPSGRFHRNRSASLSMDAEHASTWFDREPTLFSRDTESLFTKKLKQQKMSLVEEDEMDMDVNNSKERLFRRFNSDDLSSRKSFHAEGSSVTEERFGWPFDDDDDRGDSERVPLNLCMADRQSRLSSSSSIRKDIGERIRRKVERNSSSLEADRFTLSSLFDDFSVRSRLRNPEYCKTSHVSPSTHENQNQNYNEDRVLDLSMKCEPQKSNESPPEHQCIKPPPPRISDMFQNMQIKDDDYMNDAVKRYNETRQLLMQTHPEMFGHDQHRYFEVTGNKPSLADRTSQSKEGVNRRPKSWNVSLVCSDVSSSGGLRPDSAEPCLESAPFLVPPPNVTQKTQQTHQLPPLVPSASYSLVQHQQHQLQKQMNVQSNTRRSASAPSIASSRGNRHHHSDLKAKPFGLQIGSEMPSKIPKSPRSRKSISVSPSSSQQHVNDISICKFKLIKGANPVLEEKKSFFVPLIRSTEESNNAESSVIQLSNSTPTVVDSFSPFFIPTNPVIPSSTTGGSIGSKFRNLKVHSSSTPVEMGLRLPIGGGGVGGSNLSSKRLRRRSRKTIAREKLEATFREQGFLIKTQQVSSAEGAVYCKFRQLRKFTRYLFKSWKDYLPKELEDMSKVPSSTSTATDITALPHQGIDYQAVNTDSTSK